VIKESFWSKMKPKGTILIIGGAEDRVDNKNDDHRESNNQYEKFEILKELIPKNGKKGTIEVIATASGIPDEMADMYLKAFKEIGFSNVGFINIKDKIEARERKFCEKVEKAHAVFLAEATSSSYPAFWAAPIHCK
jgi:cyanophycinase